MARKGGVADPDQELAELAVSLDPRPETFVQWEDGELRCGDGAPLSTSSLWSGVMWLYLLAHWSSVEVGRKDLKSGMSPLKIGEVPLGYISPCRFKKETIKPRFTETKLPTRTLSEQSGGVLQHEDSLIFKSLEIAA